MLKEFWGLLYLVNQDRWAVSLEEQRWVRSRQLADAHIVQSDIGALLALGQMPEHGGLAHLSGADQHHGFEHSAHAHELALQISLDVIHIACPLVISPKQGTLYFSRNA